ncbi:histidine kinase [Sporomusa sp.]|uniref:histidine kinase n=1 Tax=Sporomusa sp. TaxID=2078658 RepID=UPI002CDCC495|nr:histidine kinase [Sporomusa sp.]HWR43897.1 histidine kinase [Sporomusa sp.]
MLDLLQDNEFFKLLFKIIPAGIVLADANGYVHAINPEGSRMFCVEPLKDNAYRRGGDLFRCVNAKNGCGSNSNCENCILRANAVLAISGQTVSRQKGKFSVIEDNAIKEFVLQVTAAPLVYKQHTLAILIIEDISLITELSGLIPICSSCHNIRNEKGEWINISKYLQEHSEAEFTHDYCPACSRELLNKRVKVESTHK